jgi:hypothetical protein
VLKLNWQLKGQKNEKLTETYVKLDLKDNEKKAWALINNLSGKKRKCNPKPVLDDGVTLAEDQIKAEHLN